MTSPAEEDEEESTTQESSDMRRRRMRRGPRRRSKNISCGNRPWRIASLVSFCQEITVASPAGADLKPVDDWGDTALMSAKKKKAVAKYFFLHARTLFSRGKSATAS